MYRTYASTSSLQRSPLSPSNESVLYGDTDGLTLEGAMAPNLINLVVVAACKWDGLRCNCTHVPLNANLVVKAISMIKRYLAINCTTQDHGNPSPYITIPYEGRGVLSLDDVSVRFAHAGTRPRYWGVCVRQRKGWDVRGVLRNCTLGLQS